VTRYGSIFLALALGFAGLAVAVSGVPRFVLGWTSEGFLLICVAYFAERPGVFGKRPDGSVAWWALVLGLPVLLLEYLLLFSQRFKAEAPHDEVAPEIFVGAFPSLETLPPGTETIVDLTSEFAARREVRRHPGYRCYPMLDDGFPAPGEIERIVSELVDREGPMLIHCAAGHGRSAALAGAIGLARGHFRDPRHAEASMRHRRPKIRFKSLQRERLEAWHASRE
jgi:hypothetical protein